MPTATATLTARPKARTVKVAEGLYATPTGLRLGDSRSRVWPAGVALGQFTKGAARKARKALRAAGFARHAAAPAACDHEILVYLLGHP